MEIRVSPPVLLGLFGLVFVPLSAQLLPRGSSLEPVRILGGLVVTVAIAWLLVEIIGWIRSAPADRQRDAWVNARLAAVVVLGFFLIAESTATALLNIGPLASSFRVFRDRQTLSSQAILVPHPFLIMTKNPALPYVNALGFIDRDWPQEKPAGTIRIACLGASTTEDGYPRRLSEELHARLPGLRIEVMNFANGGWTTAQSLINYVLNVRHFSPDWIIIHHAANDKRSWGSGRVRTDYSDSYTILAPKPRADDFWLRNYNSYAFGKYLFYRATGRNAGLGLYTVIYRMGSGPQRLPSATDVRLFSDNLREIVRVARADDTRVLMTTQPYSLTDLSWDEDNWVEDMKVANDAIRNVAHDLDLPLVDLDSLITGKDDLFRDPIHLRAPAVRMKAQAIADALVPLLAGAVPPARQQPLR